MPQGYGDWDGYDMYDMDAGSGEESRSQDVSWMHSRDQCNSECGSFKDTTVNRDGTPRIFVVILTRPIGGGFAAAVGDKMIGPILCAARVASDTFAGRGGSE